MRLGSRWTSSSRRSRSRSDGDRLVGADPDDRRRIYGDFEAAYAKNPGQLLVGYLDGNYVSTAGLNGLDTRRVLGHHAVGVMWNIEEWTLAR